MRLKIAPEVSGGSMIRLPRMWAGPRPNVQVRRRFKPLAAITGAQIIDHAIKHRRLRPLRVHSLAADRIDVGRRWHPTELDGTLPLICIRFVINAAQLFHEVIVAAHSQHQEDETGQKRGVDQGVHGSVFLFFGTNRHQNARRGFPLGNGGAPHILTPFGIWAANWEISSLSIQRLHRARCALR